MSEINKNKTTGLEFLSIGKKKFDADGGGVFRMDLNDVKNILINELPLDRKCLICNETNLQQLTSSIISFSPDDVDFSFVRRNAGIVEIIFSEEARPGDLSLEITTEYFYTLKESVLLKNKSLNSKIIKHECNSQEVSFEFSIEVTVSTIGEAFVKAVNTNTTIENSIWDAVEKGTSCIRSVLEGAFHIDVSHIFSDKDKNSTV